jgi:hypothetical protein
MAAKGQPLTFISYSRADSEFAMELTKELRSSGFNIWLDQLDIPTGCRWDDEVEKALFQCDIFLVILTPQSIASNNVKDEVGYVIDSNKRILPVLLKNATMPFRLRRFQYVDFTGKSFEEGIEAAKQLLRKQVDKLLSTGDWVPAEAQTENVRVLPRRLVEQQRQPEQVNPRHKQVLNDRKNEVDQAQTRPFWTANLIPILLGLALISMVCVFAVMFIWPNIRGQYMGSTTISETNLPIDNPANLRLSTIPPTEPVVLPAAPTTRPVDIVSLTFTPVIVPENTPTFTPTPPNYISTSITTIPSDPDAFVRFYFDNINNRNYDLTWSLLSDQYKAKTNPTGENQYIAFWNGISRVEITSVDFSYLTNTSIKVILKVIFYKSNSSSTSKITYYLTSDNPRGIWLFDIAPAEGGSGLDTTCSTVPKTLSVGKTAKVVTATDPLLLRESPTETAVWYEKMSPGTLVVVVDGPICSPYRSVYFWWWKVQSPSGKIGWVVEGADATDPSFILPAN